MKKLFVTYLHAVDLKELGFDEECLGLFDKSTKELVTPPEPITLVSSVFIPAPTWDQAFDWISEKYSLDINVLFEYQKNGVKWFGSIYDYTKDPVESLVGDVFKSGFTISNEYELTEEEMEEVDLLIDEMSSFKEPEYFDDKYSAKVNTLTVAIEVIKKRIQTSAILDKNES